MERDTEQKAEGLVLEVVGNPDDWYTFRFSADKLSKMVRMMGGKDLTRIYFLASLDNCLDYLENTSSHK